ncbi:MAG TPA: UDP-N-acetylglucosamine--N-acetylmuramyl-(pentapeptide) pyrophosphoryl-undecaprenol N-acetylglucosamine transferase [Candidatus Portnoybacteria bacterium]|jgi:UDP-N-acetylglucosamine--N-acetylmuramyl-(pentapeptide) pyrophosphoryl-undecaprenol N-acetylglucosamine transferase|nr:UDP-N-acetylglucosamine--N-acetylmuramyl-(pentapeptide) pyrophosphoryl-undecaprenol N-acetylglucosamine transferase [Candidatus Portnoybacteria bacterium]MDD5752210.1 UDP-N-acetylglucosamine--N-acetylmuramyl-(pentapeptide) pyrophosphoryl-undecaprenol N-acetylglucosamine transferase [Candidatus Portnoybacteria bacterium]HNU96940.1 UDP-N-acetylglucosamine--N-acetylmuramyl-(pentapeptide) pyrophosphoryl-undecaprenol N-acetylglucosamine transferase [Candidatus Portnoybacteria bacterium]HOZ16576.1 
MRILFTGGGTGGHIFPITAIKETFNNNPEFQYLGPDDFIKENLKDIKTRFILAGKLYRFFNPLILIEITKTIVGFFQSLFYLFIWIPDVVFSKGGYGAFPVLFAARLYRIPIIIHDSDAVPGRVTKKTAKFAKKIILSFENAKKYFKPKQQEKIIVIGNPIRQELLNGNKEEGRKMFNIVSTPSTTFGINKPITLILGGSQGAQKINETVTVNLPKLLEITEIIHACGENNFKELEKDTIKSPEYHLYPFLNTEQQKHAYTLADLIVNRAGAGGIFEIAALGKPSILIPLPNAAQDHQKENAYEYKKISDAIVLEQENLTPNMLIEQISNLLSNPQKMSEMSQKAKSFYNPQTAELIRDEILKFTPKQ